VQLKEVCGLAQYRALYVYCQLLLLS